MTNVMKILEMDPADHGQDLASRRRKPLLVSEDMIREL